MYRHYTLVNDDRVKQVFDNNNDTYTNDSIVYENREFTISADKLNVNTASINLIGSIDKVQFNTNTANPTYSEGLLFYDNTEKTLSYYNSSSDMTLNVGQENVIRILNKAGSSLNNGQVVYISGAQGNRPTARLARSNSHTTSSSTIGMVTEISISNNQLGYITTQGLVGGLNTSGFNEGDILWLSPTVAGGLVNVEPISDYCKVRVGFCIVSHVSNGKILVSIDIRPHKFGDVVNSNYSTFEDDGTYKAVGNATTWRDEYPSILVPVSGAAAPDSVAHVIGNVARQLYGFDGGNTQEILSGSFEIPHDMVIDPAMQLLGFLPEVHAHWRPTTTGLGVVKMFFDWEYSPPQQAAIPQTPLIFLYTISSNMQYFHLLTSFGNLPNLAYTIGGKIGFNLRRTPSDPQDTYGADIILEQIALHIPCDTLGSREIYTK